MEVRVSHRLIILLFMTALTPSAAVAEPPLSFREKVAPILVKNCLGCHSNKKAENGLNLSTFALLKKGGKSSVEGILVPGKADESELILSVVDDANPRMPYKLPPLSQDEIATLKRWVNEGAKFDGGSETETPTASFVDPLKDLPSVALTTKRLDPVNAVAFSPDGALLAAAIGREVVLFDVASGKEKSRLAADLGIVNVVRFSNDGKLLLAAGGRAGMFGAVAGWETAGFQRLFEAKEHTDAILAAAIAPDGKSFATAGYDRLVLLWDREPSPTVRKTLKDHTDAVQALAFRADGTLLATAGADRTVKLWDVASGTRTKTLSDAKAELQAVAFGIDPQTVIAGGVDRTLRIWRVVGGYASVIRSAFAHEGAILNLAVVEGRRLAVTGGEDRAVKVWDLDTLSLRNTFANQADWPQSIAVDNAGKSLAIGRADGSLSLVELDTGKAIKELRAIAPPVAPESAPKLARNATLNPPSPRGGARGANVRLTLTGEGVGKAVSVVLPETDITAKIAANNPADPNRLEVDLAIDPKARLGLHAFGVITPQGTTPFQTFAVEAVAATAEVEPNSSRETAQKVALPTLLVGSIDQPGDRDVYQFNVQKNEPLAVAVAAKSLGSTLTAVLTLRDGQGKVVASSEPGIGATDPILTATALADGAMTLEVGDANFGGSAGHNYRLSIGHDAVFESFSPLGVALEGATKVKVNGFGFGAVSEVTVTPPPGTKPGALVEVPVVLADGSRPLQPKLAVVVEGAQKSEAEPNDSPSAAESIETPSGVSGTISHDGDVDHFGFAARKGERWVIEVQGRRLGSPIDPALEILDERGDPVPRALLRPLMETEVAFRDHGASVSGIRLTRWDGLAINDVLLIGREVGRIANLPRNPDDDCQLWSEDSQRLGWLETTPEYHAMGESIYKVEVLDPSAKLPAGSTAPVTLYYRNDDGGPSFRKDARLTFDAPADGRYIVKVNDARGLGGDSFVYHLVVRKPRPDFKVNLSTENPNIPRGGTTLVTATLNRLDGFDGPVDLKVEGLPEGITATPTRVEANVNSASLALTADSSAASYTPPTWKVLATSDTGLRHEVDPGGPEGGLITVTREPNHKVTMSASRVVIRPGEDVTIMVKVERGKAFSGRVPINVQNLPQGVRVLNVGLNGVLVRDGETERSITLHAEPWVKAVERPFYAVGKAESAATEHSSAASTLVVQPLTNAVSR